MIFLRLLAIIGWLGMLVLFCMLMHALRKIEELEENAVLINKYIERLKSRIRKLRGDEEDEIF